jgi:hypothetical protein
MLRKKYTEDVTLLKTRRRTLKEKQNELGKDDSRKVIQTQGSGQN